MMRTLNQLTDNVLCYRRIAIACIVMLITAMAEPTTVSAEKVLLGQMPGKPKEAGFIAKVLIEPVFTS